MKYEVYCKLFIDEVITVDAEDEESAEIEAREIFVDNIKLYNSCFKESSCQVANYWEE